MEYSQPSEPMELTEIAYADGVAEIAYADGVAEIAYADGVAEIEYAEGLTTIDETDLETCVVIVCNNANGEAQVDNPDEPKKPKLKRRSNLTEFSDTQSTKRKNETAKRELTSIVNQLAKIDKQLKGNDEDPRASINFVATFNSFQSNRISTFKFPPEAEVKPTMLYYDKTISAVKLAVKEAMAEFVPGKEVDAAAKTSEANEFATPTKTISAFTTIPSPVAVKKQLPTSSKNLCGKGSCTFAKKMKKPIWVKCNYNDDVGQSCSFWVHAPCIGFPFLKEGEQKLLNGWYCADHTEMQMKRK